MVGDLTFQLRGQDCTIEKPGGKSGQRVGFHKKGGLHNSSLCSR